VDVTIPNEQPSAINSKQAGYKVVGDLTVCCSCFEVAPHALSLLCVQCGLIAGEDIVVVGCVDCVSEYPGTIDNFLVIGILCRPG
jgi:hypothetical protein